MKKRYSAVLIVVSTLLTIGGFNYSELEHKANATGEVTQKEINTTDLSSSKSKTDVNIHLPVKTKPVVEEQIVNYELINRENESADAKVDLSAQNVKESTAEIQESSSHTAPDSINIDGYEYVNLMDSNMENLSNLIHIAKNHNASLYAIENSDCFAMLNEKSEPIMMFSAGSRSVSVDNLGILYDMHPTIKEHIKEVAETGVEKTVVVGEYESYYIAKADGNITLSF